MALLLLAVAALLLWPAARLAHAASPGTVAVWGGNREGQLTIPDGLSGVTAIAVGHFHNLALKSDGTVVGWGDNTYGQLNIPAALSGVTAIAAGLYHSLALKSDGTVVAWGYNAAGQSTAPAGLSGVTAIAAGFSHSLAIYTPLADSTPPTTSASTTPASPNANGWFNQNVTVNLSASDNSGGSGVKSITYSASGAQTIVSTTVNAASASVSITSEGTTSLSYSATDNAGNTETTKTLTIKLDATKPTVSYSGNAGTYTVDQTVNITCTASDNLSGIASSTCATITGAAYSFALGTTTRSATATDKAGNTGSGSTTFTVGVIYDSLCTLSASFSTDPAVDQGLCDKLAAAKAAAAQGDTKNNQLNAYSQQVTAQTGKALTKQQATILTNLSKAL